MRRSAKIKRDKELVVAHDAASVTGMKHPAKRFRKVIGHVDNTGDKVHDYISCIFPVLDGKVLNVNMARALGGNLGINHINGRLVVTIDGSGCGRSKAKFGQDRPKVLGMLGSKDSSHEFGFCGTGSSDGLGLATPRDRTTGELEGISRSGATSLEVVGMSSINKATKLESLIFREWREIRRVHQADMGATGEGRIPLRLAKDDTPIFRLPKVFSYFLEHSKVRVMRAGTEFTEGNSSIANVGAASDIGIEKFTKESAISEAMLGNKGGMLVGAFRRASIGVDGCDSIDVKRSREFARRVFIGSTPTMSAKDAFNVGLGRDNNGIVILVNIKAIEVVEQSKVSEGWFGLSRELEFATNGVVQTLSKGFIGTSKSKVIDLTNHEDLFTVNSGGVDGFIVASVGKAKIFEDLRDVGFP